MISIFYDLETTDLERVGQILNFAFIAVDDDLAPIESIAANVKISRLQLPRVGAILTNRTNVIEHQKIATLTEHEAVLKINEFLNRTIARAGGSSIAMIGYNSASFDLDFLRTVFIRNGINPYNSRVQHKDLLLVSRYLMAFNDNYREKLFANAGDDKVRLKLEGLCKLFGLLEGAQDHESLSDVLLTIELAKVYKNTFQVDVRQFEPYQVKELHNKTQSELHILAEPLSSNFKPDKRCRTYPATLLDANERYALWIDLAKYNTLKKKSLDPKGAIKWKKFVEHIVIKHDEPSEEDFTSAICEALEELKGINLGNYFTETTCDIEQFIYRIRPNEIDLLRNAMNAGSSTPNFTTDMNQLLKRFWLENYAQEPTAEFYTALERYAAYRYGGKLQLTNSSEDGAKIHATLPMLISEIEKAATTATSDEDKTLIDSLRKHYLKSDIYRVAGAKLMTLEEQNV
jgi:DNA polymerase III epsilon subunit-like protein